MHLSASRIFVGGVFDQFPDALVLHYTDPSPEHLETLIADLLDRAISLNKPIGPEDFAGTQQTKLLLDRYLQKKD